MAIAETHKGLSNGLKTVPEVAAYLNVSRSTVYNLMDQGKLRWVKIGGSRRVKWADVESLVAENTFGGEK